MLIRGIEVPEKDLNQRFADNYIELHLPDNDKPEVVHVNRFQDGFLYLHKRNNKDLPIKLQQNKIRLIQEFPKKLGAIQFEDAVHFIRREPLRQWTRGLNNEVISDFCRKPGEDVFHHRLSLKRAEAMFHPVFFPDWKARLALIEKEKLFSIAYNFKFWFSGNRRAIYLWYEEIPVGEIKDDLLFFNQDCQILRQEVADEFKHTFTIV